MSDNEYMTDNNFANDHNSPASRGPSLSPGLSAYRSMQGSEHTSSDHSSSSNSTASGRSPKRRRFNTHPANGIDPAGSNDGDNANGTSIETMTFQLPIPTGPYTGPGGEFMSLNLSRVRDEPLIEEPLSEEPEPLYSAPVPVGPRGPDDLPVFFPDHLQIRGYRKKVATWEMVKPRLRQKRSQTSP